MNFKNFFFLLACITPHRLCPLTADHSGTRDDREPLANAIKNDSAVIGGNRKQEWALLWCLSLLIMVIISILETTYEASIYTPVLGTES